MSKPLSDSTVEIVPIRQVHKTLTVPGDKSISHRSLIFGALCSGAVEVRGLLNSADIQSTWDCLVRLGVSIERFHDKVVVHGVNWEFQPTTEPLDCGNSGTTMRLLQGLLAGAPHEYVFTGDASLGRRPMARVATPLKEMGCDIQLTEGNFAPLRFRGTKDLKALQYQLPVASAQVKSALILAALRGRGTTLLSGPIQSRDHSERMLKYLGADIKVDLEQSTIRIGGPQRIEARNLSVPGDFSSAAFWVVAAVCSPYGSSIRIDNVNLNPTRIGLLHVLRRMGADVSWTIESDCSEPTGTVVARSSQLVATDVFEKELPAFIDEVPVFAVAATFARGITRIQGAKELRLKESDRLAAVATNLSRMGADVQLEGDTLLIRGPSTLLGNDIDSFFDHRIAMAFSIAGLYAEGRTRILNAHCVDISYPDFYTTLFSLEQKP